MTSANGQSLKNKNSKTFESTNTKRYLKKTKFVVNRSTEVETAAK